MRYVAIVVTIVVVPLLLGHFMGLRINARHDRHRRSSALAVLAVSLLWLMLAYGLRRYAEGDGAGWEWAEWFAHRGKWYIFVSGVLFMLGAGFRSRGMGRLRLAAALALQTLMIMLLVWRTIPSYVRLPADSVRDARGYIRQSIEHTCAPVSLGNLLEVAFDQRAPSERALARLSRTTMEGTPISGLISAARALGLELSVCKVMSITELQDLNTPAIVQISTLPQVRHATLLLRIGEDNVEFVDPSYGYRGIPRALFEKIWYGKTVVFTQEVAP